MQSTLAFKRIGAYLIDYFIISFISMALVHLTFINPHYEEYNKASEEFNTLLTKYYDKDIDIEEYNNQYKDISYTLNKNGVVYIIGDIVIAFLYFSVFAFFTKGQTLGKKLMGIKIVKNKEGELSIFNYLVRTFILNGVILNLIVLIAVNFSKSTYLKIFNVGTNIDTILLIVIGLMVLFYKEGRGLHDIIAGAKVIDLKPKIVNEEIKEEKKEEDKDEK